MLTFSMHLVFCPQILGQLKPCPAGFSAAGFEELFVES
jgi:hypothetical protein